MAGGNEQRTWTHWPKRGLNILWKTTKYTYLGLSLIPTTLTLAAGYHWAVGHPEQVVRAHAFFAWTGFTAIPLSMFLLAAYPFVVILDPQRRAFLDEVQRTWAKMTIYPFFKPQFEGIERIKHLTEGDVAVVYVSNHQSWTDIYALLCLPFPIRFVSKEEIFYIPLVGWVMGLIGHVGVRRGNRQSRGSVVDACVQKLQAGVSVYLFAEGTRSRDGLVQPFKRGAFVIAKEAHVPIVPISISGTGKLMPARHGETWLERSEDAPVLIHIHKPLYVEDFEDSDSMLAETQRIIEGGILSQVPAHVVES